PALLATDVADQLVAAGVPFHRAHQAVGRLLTAAQDQDRDFRDYSAAELAGLEPDLPWDAAALRALTPLASLARRNQTGGTAPEQVRQQAARTAERARACGTRSY
ncbi:MAG: hypothetical protein ACRD1Y_00310, partial [Terriglobales bacterium]